MTKIRKHEVVPEPIRTELKHIAASVWSDIASDLGSEAEEMSLRDIVECIRDANRMLTRAQNGRMIKKELSDSVIAWLKEHEYDLTYRQDLNRLVSEIV